jgi:hypothetical protein
MFDKEKLLKRLNFLLYDADGNRDWRIGIIIKEIEEGQFEEGRGRGKDG